MEHSYEKSDVVYKKEGAGRKLDEKYTGPYIIVKCLSPSVYKIQGKKLALVVHYDWLKKYESVTLPAWIIKGKI